MREGETTIQSLGDESVGPSVCGEQTGGGFRELPTVDLGLGDRGDDAP